MCNHHGLHHQDWMMHLKCEGLSLAKSGLEDLKIQPLSGGNIGSYPYLLSSIAWIIFTLAYLLSYISIALIKEKKVSLLHIIIA
jgi:hypothetical protein